MAKATKKEIVTFLKNWSKELRSGTYTQAREELIDVEIGTDKVVGYCCLGVATCVTGEVHKVLAAQLTGEYDLNTLTDSRKYVPKANRLLVDNGEFLLRKYFPAGERTYMLKTPTGSERDVDDITFIMMNDDLHMTFVQIADVVDIIVYEMTH